MLYCVSVLNVCPPYRLQYYDVQWLSYRTATYRTALSAMPNGQPTLEGASVPVGGDV